MTQSQDPDAINPELGGGPLPGISDNQHDGRAYLVALHFRIDCSDYPTLAPNRDVRKLVNAILAGEAEMPAQYDLKIYREVG